MTFEQLTDSGLKERHETLLRLQKDEVELGHMESALTIAKARADLYTEAKRRDVDL